MWRLNNKNKKIHCHPFFVTPYAIFLAQWNNGRKIVGDLTLHERIQATRTAPFTSGRLHQRSIQPSRCHTGLLLCHFAFSVEAFFYSAWVRNSPEAHLTKFCPFTVPSAIGQNIPARCHGIPLNAKPVETECPIEWKSWIGCMYRL